MPNRPNHILEFSHTMNFPPEVVYDAITDLTKTHMWSSGTLAIEGPKRMERGVVYTLKSVTAGQINTSEVHIIKAIPKNVSK